jgi:hypothetical protein
LPYKKKLNYFLAAVSAFTVVSATTVVSALVVSTVAVVSTAVADVSVGAVSVEPPQDAKATIARIAITFFILNFLNLLKYFLLILLGAKR